ncbi:MAG TPA: hypothetical protein VMO76_14815 [Candidatus Udaeobacter sp.]|nr:hypothetical protein [Candidatus Udaeobacter sp.]
MLIRRLNPVCQRIVDNPFGGREQCHSPSAMVHHKIAPTVDAAQFFRASNLIALCDACHGHMEGTPEWTAGADYVETVLPQYGF